MTTETVNLTDEELLYTLNKEHRTVLMPVIIIFGLEVVFGIVGNILTLYVFYFRYQACNFRYFVICLALIDFTSCLTTIPGSMITQLFWFDYRFPHICKTKDFFNQFTACSEAAILTAIALDRYRKVCKPLKWQIKHRQALYACVGVLCVSACLAIPTPIFWGMRTRIRTDIIKGRNITVTLCEKDDKYLDTDDAVTTTSMNGCLVFLTLVIMLVLYVHIMIHFISKRRVLSRQRTCNTNEETTEIDGVRKSNNINNDNSAEDSGDGQSSTLSISATFCAVGVTNGTNVGGFDSRLSRGASTLLDRARRKTMIGLYLSVIFIVTTIIFWTLISIVAATNFLEESNNKQKAVYTFFLRLYFINHVINPVLYGLMDKRFQAEMLRLKDVVWKRCFCVFATRCRHS